MPVLKLATSAADRLQLMWVSRDGAARPVEPGWTFDPSPQGRNRSWFLSPDGTRIAVKILTDLGSDIWIKQLPNGPLSRFTFFDGEDRQARFSPDGSTLTWISSRGGNLDIWSQPADGTGEPELLLDSDADLTEAVWSPDMTWLVLRTAGTAAQAGGRDIQGFRPGKDTIPLPLVATEYDEGGPAISHDGRWLAYHSDETGRREVFVRPFPDVNRGKWQVSSGGGRAPLWAHNGREIFYLTDNNEVMVAEVDPGPPFAVGARRMLFDAGADYYFMNNSSSWDITRDDATFLMARTVGSSDPRSVVLVNNFFEELKRRVPN